ncbi:MAG TPA: pirin family protein [Burkholderiales bacterium]|nr:pirin family protein [Burkholderiales bacterium]
MTLDILRAHVRDLGGGLSVRRLLPGHPHQMVGPFIFFDHMGPTRLAPGGGVDVRPHPHVGLATVTYLFDGALMHRDSLGTVQKIEPGDVNWMTAGGGIVHSERSPAEDRAAGPKLHGIQTWVALPQAHEATAPGFSHHPKPTLPAWSDAGVDFTLIVGRLRGRQAPVPTFSDMFYVAARLAPGAGFALSDEHEQRGLYVVEGGVSVAGATVPEHCLAVVAAPGEVEVRAPAGARLILLGGTRLDGGRHIWWNFVASSLGAIEAAKQRWRERAFPDVPGDAEYIPLPEK